MPNHHGLFAYASVLSVQVNFFRSQHSYAVFTAIAEVLATAQLVALISDFPSVFSTPAASRPYPMPISYFSRWSFRGCVSAQWYIRNAFMLVFRHDSPSYTPFLSLTWYLLTGELGILTNRSHPNSLARYPSGRHRPSKQMHSSM